MGSHVYHVVVSQSHSKTYEVVASGSVEAREIAEAKWRTGNEDGLVDFSPLRTRSEATYNRGVDA